MTNIEVFNFENQSVRTEMINNEVFFCAGDVCNILELGNSRQALARVEKDDVILNDIIDTIGRQQKASFVNEAGLYALIFQSRKKEANKFKQWVFKDVLPQIRKTGNYAISNNLPKIDSTFLLQIAEEMQKKENLIAEQQHKIESQDDTIYNISNTQDSYSIRESKNRLMCEEKQLKDFLKSKKWIQYLSDGEEGKKMYSTAYSKENGFAIDKAVLNKANKKYYHQCRITNKGLDYLIKHRQEILTF